MRFFINAGVFGILFYLNYLWLVPRYFIRNRKPLFFLFAIILIIGLYFISNYISQVMPEPQRNREIAEFIERISPEERRRMRPPFHLMQVYGYFLISFLITGVSMGLRVMEQHSASEKRQKELEKEKLNSELAFLKNQVSPHFFFNTLNNIYSLIEVNTNDAQEAVLKLSKLMRYLLYESEQGETLLSHEVDFMNHYIALMKLRLSEKVKLAVRLPEKNTEYKIPPLLFIPFIENAFKHGISYREKSFISISMEVAGNSVDFKCINSLGKQSEEAKSDNHSGIGLKNVKKRLNLLFPGKHNLEITHEDETFSVSLSIELK